MSQPANNSDGLFNTAIFAVLLLAGVFVGHAVCGHVVPDSQGAIIVGYIMLPLGVILGLSFGEGVLPPISLLNLFSVFDGRFSIEEVINRGGGNGGSASIAVAIAAGTAATCVALAIAVSTFFKPEIAMGELMMWFGGTGLVYGAVVAAMVFFATETKA